MAHKDKRDRFGVEGEEVGRGEEADDIEGEVKGTEAERIEDKGVEKVDKAQRTVEHENPSER